MPLPDRLQPVEALTQRDRVYGLLWLVRNGIASQIMETLTIGAFLVAFALELGASNLVIGILAALPHLTQFAQLPAVLLVERVRRRKAICVLAGGASRPLLLVIAAAAIVADERVGLALLTAGIAGRYLLGAVVGSSWNAWMRDLVPMERMGMFFANRLMLMTIVGTILSLAAAGFVDLWKARSGQPVTYAYAILLVGAFVGGVISVYCMTRMPEPRMAGSEAMLDFRTILTKPFGDLNFRRLILFLGSWNFAINLAAPFFTVHMLKRLELDLTMVTVLTVISQAANVLVIREWGRIADRFSNKSVLAVCGPTFILAIFLWIFTTSPEWWWGTLPLLVLIHVLTGVATAGVTLAGGNIGLKLAPKGEATATLAAISLVNAASAGLAPVIGGLLADFFVASELSLIIHFAEPGEAHAIEAINLKQWDFFFLLAALLGTYSLHRLAFVREVGEVSERIVLTELLLDARRTVRNMSSVAGLKQLSEFPLELVRRRLRRRQHRRRPAKSKTQ